jgi:hypothetical protein
MARKFADDETPKPRDWEGPEEKGRVMSKQTGRLSYNPHSDKRPGTGGRRNPTKL